MTAVRSVRQMVEAAMLRDRVNDTELAKRAGVHVNTIRRLRGTRPPRTPRLTTVSAVADALGIDKVELWEAALAEFRERNADTTAGTSRAA